MLVNKVPLCREGFFIFFPQILNNCTLLVFEQFFNKTVAIHLSYFLLNIFPFFNSLSQGLHSISLTTICVDF